jgi:hypothetical protein
MRDDVPPGGGLSVKKVRFGGSAGVRNSANFTARA